MLEAFDTLLQTTVSAKDAADHGDNEEFRYECLRCGEEVFLAAQDSTYKAAHFRHRRDNNNKECELYLRQTGKNPDSHLIVAKRYDRVEFYYRNMYKAFYMRFSYNDAEITTYEKDNTYVEVRTEPTGRPFFYQRINHDFIYDNESGIQLEKFAPTYYISNTLKKVKRKYSLFGTSGPAFFKIQGGDTEFTAKFIKGKNIYTNVKYFISWTSQNTEPRTLVGMPGVQIYKKIEFKTMDTSFKAMVVRFEEKNSRLDDLLQRWGYNLDKSEELVLLWPPAYESEEILNVSSKCAFVYSSFDIKPGNTNIPKKSIIKIDDHITKFDINDNIKILKKNVEISLLKTDFLKKVEYPAPQLVTETKYIIPKEGTFYHFSLRGVEKLNSGKTVFLTNSSSVVEYCGNYVSKIVKIPNDKELSLIEKIRAAFSYYWVLVPYDKKLEEYLTDDIEEYIIKCKEIGFINKAVKTIIEGK